MDFPAEVIAHLEELTLHAPTIVVAYLERPAVVADLLPSASVLIGDFGASDQVVIDALLGRTEFRGTPPFDLPRSMAAIEAPREDVPFDTADPVFPHGADIRRPVVAPIG